MTKRARSGSLDEGEVERCKRPSCDACAGDSGSGSRSGGVPLKKRRNRVRPSQLPVLETAFVENPGPNTERRRELARQLGMCERQLQIWFQNRRAKAKMLEKRRRELGYVEEAPPPKTPPLLGDGYKPELEAMLHEDDMILILPTTSVKIGDWVRFKDLSDESELVAYYCDARSSFTWFVRHAGISFKMEFTADIVKSARLENTVPMKGALIFELVRPPTMYMDFRRADGANKWCEVQDWTAHAMASQCLVHRLDGLAAPLSHVLRGWQDRIRGDADMVHLVDPTRRADEWGVDWTPFPLCHVPSMGFSTAVPSFQFAPSATHFGSVPIIHQPAPTHSVAAPSNPAAGSFAPPRPAHTHEAIAEHALSASHQPGLCAAPAPPSRSVLDGSSTAWSSHPPYPAEPAPQPMVASVPTQAPAQAPPFDASYGALSALPAETTAHGAALAQQHPHSYSHPAPLYAPVPVPAISTAPDGVFNTAGDLESYSNAARAAVQSDAPVAISAQSNQIALAPAIADWRAYSHACAVQPPGAYAYQYADTGSAPSVPPEPVQASGLRATGPTFFGHGGEQASTDGTYPANMVPQHELPRSAATSYEGYYYVTEEHAAATNVYAHVDPPTSHHYAHSPSSDGTYAPDMDGSVPTTWPSEDRPLALPTVLPPVGASIASTDITPAAHLEPISDPLPNAAAGYSWAAPGHYEYTAPAAAAAVQPVMYQQVEPTYVPVPSNVASEQAYVASAYGYYYSDEEMDVTPAAMYASAPAGGWVQQTVQWA